MERIRFHVTLTSDEFLHFYNGSAQAVLVTADDGRRIQIPAGRFREFVQQEGVHGYFEIILNAQNKLLSIKRLSL